MSQLVALLLVLGGGFLLPAPSATEVVFRAAAAAVDAGSDSDPNGVQVDARSNSDPDGTPQTDAISTSDPDG
jgi:hypothetical protein